MFGIGGAVCTRLSLLESDEDGKDVDWFSRKSKWLAHQWRGVAPQQLGREWCPTQAALPI